MFGGQGGRSRSRAQRGADLREDLTLEFEEAVFGVTKQVQVRRLEECDQCKGSGVAPGKASITCTTCATTTTTETGDSVRTTRTTTATTATTTTATSARTRATPYIANYRRP